MKWQEIVNRSLGGKAVFGCIIILPVSLHREEVLPDIS